MVQQPLLGYTFKQVRRKIRGGINSFIKMKTAFYTFSNKLLYCYISGIYISNIFNKYCIFEIKCINVCMVKFEAEREV